MRVFSSDVNRLPENTFGLENEGEVRTNRTKRCFKQNE